MHSHSIETISKNYKTNPCSSVKMIDSSYVYINIYRERDFFLSLKFVCCILKQDGELRQIINAVDIKKCFIWGLNYLIQIS